MVRCFAYLGSYPPECFVLDGESVQSSLQPFEAFTCLPYHIHCKDGPLSLPELRWKLYSSKSMEIEELPPNRSALVPQLQRINHVCLVHRSYNRTHPNLPPVTESGWQVDNGIITPVYNLMPPAPKNYMDFTECGCESGCDSKRCRCFKYSRTCTTLCKCNNNCRNKPDDSSLKCFSRITDYPIPGLKVIRSSKL